MGNIFAGSEIVEMGIQIEKNGKDFYEILAKKIKNLEAKEIFKYLAGEETKHIIVFKELLSSVEKYEPTESYPGEYFLYLKALADDYVFTKEKKGEELAKKITSDKEAINLGISFEKDSILFFEGIKKVVLERDHKVINELITQERSHFRQLSELKSKLRLA